MATFDDILAAVCSQVTPVSSNDFQQIYLLGDAKEAKLACDILVTHGFEAKLYADSDADTAKLYINRPAAETSPESRLQAALVYAGALKNIKQSLDILYKDSAIGMTDYTFTFANAPANGKQIAIYMSPTAAVTAPLPTAPVKQAVAGPQGSRPMGQKPMPGKKKKVAVKSDKEGFSSASALAKTYPGMSKEELQEDAHMRNWFSRMFVQHIASNSMEILMTITGALGIITLVIMSKGFFCPDLAVSKYKQNRSWYCTAGQEDDSKKH